MKRKLQMVGILLLTIGVSAATAQRDTLAYWGFDASTNDYQYWGSDEYGTTRPFAVNEYKDKKDATFGAFREGVREGETLDFYEGNHTLVTTTNLGVQCISQAFWQRDDELGRTTRYWLLDNLSTENTTDIKVNLYLVSVGTVGPTQFRFGYKVGDGAWVDDVFKDVRTGASATSKIGSNAADLWTHVLPAACDNQVKVAFRWCVNDIAVGGGALGSGGTSRVDDVLVTGVKTASSILPVSTVSGINIAGSKLTAKENVFITVYNQVGTTLLNSAELSAGASVSLPQGLIIIKVVAAEGAGVIKTVIR